MSKKDHVENYEGSVEYLVNLLREHPQVKALFLRFQVPIEAIHEVPIDFEDLDVSAKAKKGRIIINRKLVADGDFVDDLHYIVHELVHVLQQHTGAVNDYGDLSQYDYLDNPLEIEAFQEQIKFIAAYKSPEEAEEYLQGLLDFHELEGKDRKRKEFELRGEDHALHAGNT